MLDINPQVHFHYHKNSNHFPENRPAQVIEGTGQGWATEVNGNVAVNAVPDRTTLYVRGGGALKINGCLKIGA
jgi:hypothetical protein